MIKASDEEVLLRTVKVIEYGMPSLQCSACGHIEDHFFYYSDDTYSSRYVKRCPKCGRKILGVVVR